MVNNIFKTKTASGEDGIAVQMRKASGDIDAKITKEKLYVIQKTERIL